LLCRESGQILVGVWRRAGFSSSGPALCVERRLPPRKSGPNGGASRPPRPSQENRQTFTAHGRSLPWRSFSATFAPAPCTFAPLLWSHERRPAVLCSCASCVAAAPALYKKCLWQCEQVGAVLLPYAALYARAENRAVGLCVLYAGRTWFEVCTIGRIAAAQSPKRSAASILAGGA
jgi:hypothetical protein